MSLFSLMESLGTLERPTIGRDAAQGVTQDPFEPPASAPVAVACSVQPAGKSVVTLYAQRNISVTATIYCAFNIGAQVNDKFLVTNSSDGSQHVFLVHGFSKNLFGRRLSPYSMDVEELV